jgi:hypothetical protein
MVLPSARSTLSESSLSVTFRAVASLMSAPEVLIPFLHQPSGVLRYENLDPADFRPTGADLPEFGSKNA